MNKIINELFNRAGGWTEVCDVSGEEILTYNEHLDPEKFAKLIVRECIEQGNNLANHYINTHSEQEQVMLLASIADYSNEIKKHFGVEE